MRMINALNPVLSRLRVAGLSILVEPHMAFFRVYGMYGDSINVLLNGP